MFIAHIRESDFSIQTVEEHKENVAYLARMYGETIGLGAMAELTGFLHDMGKLTIHFSEYLENAVIKGEVALKKIDHSTAGAKYLYENFYNGSQLQKFVVEIVGMAILSHHSGIQNFTQLDLSESDYVRRMTKDLDYYEEVKRNFESNPSNRSRVEKLLKEAIDEFKNFTLKIKNLEHPFVYINLLQKLILSILLDADRTDTRRFEENDQSPLRVDFPFAEKYRIMLDGLKTLNSNKDKIQILRTLMSERCDEKAGEASGIYTLSIPTGGGKTFSSLRYALKHAYLYEKERIIYVVPYTTILEQNAQSVREILNDYEHVLEHHANVIEEMDSDEDYYGNPIQKKMQLARDNWDMPIIFTTMVQFLDAFYQKGTRKTRRLHRLTNSVIVIDEVQSVPYIHFSLFNMAINFLHYIGNSSIILSTATQPTVGEMEYAIRLTENHEIIPGLTQIVKEFERVKIHNCITKGGWDSAQLAQKILIEMENRRSALIILNTKSAVRKLYDALNEHLEFNSDINLYHLSTSMCPAHRQKVLSQIRDELGKERVICVSTQLIEAGVDISFEAVFRSLAGLDSIAQAAGRCNRHGEKEYGDVFVFKSNEENLKKLPEIRIGQEVMENHIVPMENWEEQLFNPKMISKYFKEFDLQASREIYKNPPGLEVPLIDLINAKTKHHYKTLSHSSFKTLEEHFEAISSPTKSVIVPYDEEGEEIIAKLNENLSLRELNRVLKKSQRFVVNVFECEYQKLKESELLFELFNEGIIAVRPEGYSDEFGLSLDGQGTSKQFYF